MASYSAEMVEWFDQFLAAFQCMRSLKDDDPRYYEAFERLVVCHRVWCGHTGSVSLCVQPKILEINGNPVDLASGTEAMQWFHDRCRKRALKELLFLGMLAPHDFQVFMTLILQDRGLFEDPDFPANFLLAEQVSLIQINPPSVEDSFFGAAPFQIDTLDLTDLAQEMRPNPIEASAIQDTLSGAESQELRERIKGYLHSGKLEAIHNSISHLRGGLDNRFREIQIRGYVGIRVVVETLIEQMHTQVLYAVFKALPKTVSQDAAADLLAFHLGTFSRVMDYFKQHDKIRPMVFGLEWLATWRFHSRSPLCQIAKELLEQHFDPDVIVRIVTLLPQDHVLAEHWRKLLANYPRALAKPLLFYLYDSEEKEFRQLLIQVLQGVMGDIRTDIVMEVRRAMDRKAPWYIKRNLLTLLADEPPAALSPLVLRMLREETQPQLRETLFACGFKLKTPKLQRICEEALREASDEAHLIGLIQHVREAGGAVYLPFLFQKVNKKSSDRLVDSALAAIAAIGNEKAVTFLDRVLSQRGLFNKRPITRMRRLAARALAKSDTEQVLQLAEKYAADRDDEVREACLAALKLRN